jgi:hypothetical protein
MENKIVVHMKDGVIRKGVTHDFEARKDTFHLLPAEGGGDASIGFYFFPANEAANNIRIFVIRSAMEELRMVS